MLLNPFKLRDETQPLVASMTGVKMGDQVAFVGCSHGGRLAAVAAKVGLSGRAIAVVPDSSSAERASNGAANAGVLVEVMVAPPTALPLDDGGFNLSVVDDTGGLLGGISADDRAALARELLRLLGPGGRVIVIGSTPRSGLGGLFAGASGVALLTSSGEAKMLLEAAGFKSVRTLAEREGLVFVEGIKPRDRQSG